MCLFDAIDIAANSNLRKLSCIVIPGGIGINNLLTDEETLHFIRSKAHEARYITSVCSGSLVLAAAGLLHGKRATSHWASVDLLSQLGAIPVSNERAVIDGNIITAGGVTSGIDFGFVIIAELFGTKAAQIIQLSLEYNPLPPYNAGTPMLAPPDVLAEVQALGQARRQERERIVALIASSKAAESIDIV